MTIMSPSSRGLVHKCAPNQLIDQFYTQLLSGHRLTKTSLDILIRVPAGTNQNFWLDVFWAKERPWNYATSLLQSDLASCSLSYILWLNEDKHVHIVVAKHYILFINVVYMRVCLKKRKSVHIMCRVKHQWVVIALCRVGLHTCHYAALYGRILVHYRPSDKPLHNTLTSWPEYYFISAFEITSESNGDEL